MSRGNNRGGRGGRGGRGRGGWGWGNGRGRGSPFESFSPRGGPNRGRGRGGYIPMGEIDEPIQLWPGNNGFSSPRGRGRGGHTYQQSPFGGSSPRRGTDSPRGRGRGTPRYVSIPDDIEGLPEVDRPFRGGSDRGFGRGRGRGNSNSQLRAGAPLSKVWYTDRPLLRPIEFVRSVHTATLFQEEEEILQAVVEDVDDNEQSHVPTADRVTRVFSGDADSGSENDEEIEEIDFADIGRIQAAVDAAAMEPGPSGDTTISYIEEKFTGFYIDTTPDAVPDDKAYTSQKPVLEDDDEIIVYNAPNPRAGPPSPLNEQSSAEMIEHTTKTIPAPTPVVGVAAESSQTIPLAAPSSEVPVVPSEPSFETSAHIILSGDNAIPSSPKQTHGGSSGEETPAPSHPESDIPPVSSFENVTFKLLAQARKPYQRRVHPVTTPRSLLRNRTRTKRKRKSFAALGALISEAHLRDEAGREVDPRRNEQRRGDSDVDWGDETSDEDEGVLVGDVDRQDKGKQRAKDEDELAEVTDGVDGMVVDDDYDVAAMKSFVESMGVDRSKFMTMDDIADEERMLKEDFEDENGHGDHTEGSEDESSDEAETAEDGFQAGLQKIRSRAKGKGKVRDDDEDLEDDYMQLHLAEDWDDGSDHDDLIAEIQALVDENADILSSKNRKQKKALFRALRTEPRDLDEYETMMSTPSKRKRAEDIPLELRGQWEKDRQKKADNKIKRNLERQRIASDPTLSKKDRKKALRKRIRAMREEEEEEEDGTSGRTPDLVSVEREIRLFVEDVNARELAFPPYAKSSRAKIHEIALSYRLKSMSRGDGKDRFITLTKTTKSGIGIDQKRINNILRTGVGRWDSDLRKGKGKKATSLAKHREGDEVGKSAPKIGETNIGFQMLAAMGWSEGDRIGLSGGLDAPLKAIMKKSKLGLGAL